MVAYNRCVKNLITKIPIRLRKNVRKPQGGIFLLTLYLSCEQRNTMVAKQCLTTTYNNDLTWAVKSVASVSRITGAIDAARYVCTGGKLTASSVVLSTFVYVCVHHNIHVHWQSKSVPLVIHSNFYTCWPIFELCSLLNSKFATELLSYTNYFSSYVLNVSHYVSFIEDYKKNQNSKLAISWHYTVSDLNMSK